MIKVKICGITNLEDALVAIELGADYLGFIFYPPSKRGIDVQAAHRLVQQLRRQVTCPTLVGVFVDETAEKMAEIVDFVNLDLAQLSGNEAPALIGEASSPIYGRAYKAIKPTSYRQAEAEARVFVTPAPSERYASDRPFTQAPAPSLLIDAYHPTLPGGTGEMSDWEMSAQLVQKFSGVMLAGGVTPENVALAIKQVRPFAIDTASGVEAAPGKKDPHKIRQLIQNAKSTLS